ncbi:response regulator [Pseudomonas sp. PP3]|uniref:response regulator n=1 Tax=Pseudomonas sp. PP3 TaxID=2815936 RepID=UPI001FD469A3|nr:response regulator [Pseudomonas sp. PP3]
MKIICVVDDDPSVRKSLVNLLRSEGFAAVGFESGEALLQSNMVDTAHCILLDMFMPGLRGIDVQLELSKNLKPPAIVCMSAYWNDAILERAKNQGAIDCLSKPFSSDTLLRSISLIG